MTVPLRGFNPNEQQPAGLPQVPTTVAAAGSAQGNAAALSKGLNYVTGSDGTKGVILPVAAAGERCEAINPTGSNMLVYPQAGGAINGGSANAALTVATKKSVILYCVDGLNWWGPVGA